MKYAELFFGLLLFGLGFLFFRHAAVLAISAGIGIFLFGMISLENGFKAFSGGLLETLLKRSTNTLSKSLTFGALATALMQSSSLVSVLTISFLSAGLITLLAGIGIIFGANLGTTATAWLISGLGVKIDIGVYALPMLTFGVIFILRKQEFYKGAGYILVGLGFIFLGIHTMKEGFESFKDIIDLTQYAISGYKGVFIYIGFGVLITLIMQSSSASLVVTITALSTGQIGYENALALAIGSNLGTTITAVLGSLGSNIDGKRLAVAHLIFNLTTGILAAVFIYQLVDIVATLSDWVGIAPEDDALKLALFHTLFNLMGVLLMLPFIRPLVKFLEATIVLKTPLLQRTDDAIYLSDTALNAPQAAKEVLFQETQHLFVNAQSIIAYAINITPKDITSALSPEKVIALRAQPMNKNIEDLYERKFKPIYSKIIDFAVRAGANASEADTLSIMDMRRATQRMAEAIKDAKHLQPNMLRYLTSPNTFIKDEYDYIRISLIKHLRLLQEIMESKEEEALALSLGKVAQESKAFDVISGRSLDTLIRENRITSTMATSLMNDTAYALSIATNVIGTAKILLTHNAFFTQTHEVIFADELF
ncbi:MAG: Na/Pi cotransporter family protein [Campylobacterales bacterium]|nr:Na/Pi cotransporter family protein [Campylobacterales bacterium]